MTGWVLLPTDPRRIKRNKILFCALIASIPLAFAAGVAWQQGRPVHLDKTQIRQLEQELETLRQQVAVVQSAEQLSRQANEQSRLTIKLLEEQIYKQQQDLAFYKGVVAPASRQDALNIKAFEALPTEKAGRYRYKVFLNRQGQGNQLLEGFLHITVTGKQKGKPVTLTLKELAADLSTDMQGQPIAFSFKHFLSIPEAAQFAELQLPDGFVAEQVSIKADIKGQKPVVRTFEWNYKE